MSDDSVSLINGVTAAPERQQALVDLLTRATEASVRRRPA